MTDRNRSVHKLSATSSEGSLKDWYATCNIRRYTRDMEFLFCRPSYNKDHNCDVITVTYSWGQQNKAP
jgi:hypothetical protein